MSCRRRRQGISDRLDGALDSRRARKLDVHLRSCPACRAYEGRLRRLNEEVSRPGKAVFTREYGEDFLRRLESRLDGEGPRVDSANAPFWRRRWVWGSAGLAAAAAGLAVWFFLLRPVPRPEIYVLSESDAFSRVYGQFAQNPEMENKFNDLLLSSIDDSVMPAEDGFEANPFDNPLLWEGVSKEEMKQLEEAITAEQTM